ncbi:hypothetical protein GCA01S_072_00100 [Parageobacillus caldoxylosilyticus NBRC 107762]|uniref:Uncharacterized protein n=1 Tax=Parageobacillus caldoxylosilyticus NBRC 107762 TaxID=1220594 RepID=A0A023DJS8_9BACL|nr:hypothetical protein GCA01S_072_00100 [Parageobacillus caldoxylosilyticus NBRC 107762]
MNRDDVHASDTPCYDLYSFYYRTGNNASLSVHVSDRGSLLIRMIAILKIKYLQDGASEEERVFSIFNIRATHHFTGMFVLFG